MPSGSRDHPFPPPPELPASEEYDSWSARYIEATRKRSHEAEVCVEDLERDLDLIGAVAIEDSLQPNQDPPSPFFAEGSAQ